LLSSAASPRVELTNHPTPLPFSHSAFSEEALRGHAISFSRPSPHSVFSLLSEAPLVYLSLRTPRELLGPLAPFRRLPPARVFRNQRFFVLGPPRSSQLLRLGRGPVRLKGARPYTEPPFSSHSRLASFLFDGKLPLFFGLDVQFFLERFGRNVLGGQFGRHEVG